MYDDLHISKVKESEIPAIIASQFHEIINLQKNVDRAMQKAEKAKESADRAYCESTGMFQRKAAIESLQSATRDLAESQISASEAQKISFEYQAKLGKITQYLFGLGVSNLASNRSVVRELELKLKDASEEELSELVREEIINVIKQLKSQEDIINKQAELTQRTKQHEKKILVMEVVQEEYGRILADYSNKYEELDRLIFKNTKRDAEQTAKNLVYDRLIQELYDENIKLKKSVENNKEEIQSLLNYITEMLNTKTDKKTTIILFILATVGVIALFNLF